MVVLEVTKLLLSLLDQQAAWVLGASGEVAVLGRENRKFYEQQSYLLTTELGGLGGHLSPGS